MLGVSGATFVLLTVSCWCCSGVQSGLDTVLLLRLAYLLLTAVDCTPQLVSCASDAVMCLAAFLDVHADSTAHAMSVACSVRVHSGACNGTQPTLLA
jgi:hypothetical protein